MRKQNRFIAAILLCLAFALWTASLNTLELWGDELYTKVVTARPLPDMLHMVLIDAVHPPLYYLLIHTWQHIVGYSAYALRMPSVLAMVLGVALLARIAREIGGPRSGRVALLIAVANPFLFWYAREMRMYAPLFALAATELLLLILALDGHRVAWLALAGVTALLVNTHYFGFFVLLPPLAYLAAERRWRRKLPLWIVAQVAGGLTFLPWLSAWLNRDPKYIGAGWIPQLHPFDFLLTLRTFFLSGMESSPLLLVLGGLGGGLAFLAAFRRPDKQRRRPLLVLGWGLPWALIAAISWTVLPVYVDRYLIILLPSLLVWMAWGFAGLPRVFARLALAGFAVGMIGGLVGVMTQAQWQRPQWQAAIAWLQENVGTNAVLLTNSPYAEPARLAYAPAMIPFTRLVSSSERLPGTRSPDPRCDQGATCWAVWERFVILMHFPPTADDADTIVARLAPENATAAWLLTHRDRCTITPFTHIEVWRCGD